MRKVLSSLLCLCILGAGATMAQAAAIGKVRTASGEAFVVRGGERIPASVGTQVEQSDVVETGSDGKIGIAFLDNSVMSTGPNSRLSLDQFTFNTETMQGSFLSKLSVGTLSVISGDIARGSPEAMKVRTPSSILGVRGTRFLVRVGKD